jgi:predicted transcriptional regulator
LMDPVLLRAPALIMILFLVAVPCATAATGRYIVTPAAVSAITGPPQDIVPISFFELGIRGMIIAICLSFCPVFVYPVEIFFFLKLMSFLGYRKVEQYAVSFNQKRQKLFDCIAANPGAKFNTLERLTGIKEGTLKYHLLVLEMKRRIVSFDSGRSVRYFENNGRYTDIEKKVFLHLQDPTTRRILEILASSPEVSRKEIAETVGIAGPSITWHTRRLSGDGVITVCRNGKGVRYTLCPAGVNIFRRYFAQDGGSGTGSGEEPGE